MSMHSDHNATFAGHYYDGESAMARKVVVRLSTNVIVINDEEGVAAHWTYSGLLAPDPVQPNKSTRVTHQDTPYARLVIDDPGFARGILSRAPQLSTHERRARSFRLVGLCFGAAVALLALGWVSITYAPGIIASIMPDSWRGHIGLQVERAVAGDRRACTNEQGVAALDALGQRLRVGAAAGGVNLTVYDLGYANAFALPGDRIVISLQLISEVASADAVAGVLAHELGHVIERDSEAQLVRLMGLTLVQEALFGSGSGVTDAVSGAASLLALMSYSRDAERRADLHAIALLRASGIDVAGLIEFFEKIEAEQAGSDADDVIDDLTRLASSHPHISERLEALADLQDWDSSPALSDEQWSALKSICSD